MYLSSALSSHRHLVSKTVWDNIEYAYTLLLGNTKNQLLLEKQLNVQRFSLTFSQRSTLDLETQETRADRVRARQGHMKADDVVERFENAVI